MLISEIYLIHLYAIYSVCKINILINIFKFYIEYKRLTRNRFILKSDANIFRILFMQPNVRVRPLTNTVVMIKINLNIYKIIKYYIHLYKQLNIGTINTTTKPELSLSDFCFRSYKLDFDNCVRLRIILMPNIKLGMCDFNSKNKCLNYHDYPIYNNFLFLIA